MKGVDKNLKIWKYQVIEYEVKKMSDKEIEYAKTLHKTNSKLLFYLIIVCMKLSRVKYEKVIRGIK